MYLDCLPECTLNTLGLSARASDSFARETLHEENGGGSLAQEFGKGSALFVASGGVHQTHTMF